MIQEYLFSDKSKRSEIEKYSPEGVQIKISDIYNSDCWVVSYSLPNNNKSAAKRLSEIDQYIIKTFQPTVLTNESAAYFNKALFPLANEFERKLRKLLYLKSALNKKDRYTENIKDLESQELGKIFELLFTDSSFVKNVKKTINNDMSWQYTKAELHNTIDNIKEETIWEKLIGKETIPALWDNFIIVNNNRNDIMHAHNISYQEYQESKKLFKIIIDQLNAEIDKIIRVTEKTSSYVMVADFNTVLGKAIDYVKIISYLNQLAQDKDAIKATASPTLLSLIEFFTRTPKPSPELTEALSKFSEYIRSISKANQPLTETTEEEQNAE